MVSYKRQFQLFLCFSIRNQVERVLSVGNFLGFLEFLIACNLSPRAVLNYASAIKSYVSLYQLPKEWLSNSMISNYLRAIHIQITHVKRPKETLTMQELGRVSRVLDRFDNPLVYRSAILLSFFGFLRISNLVAPTQGAFDCTRQLCRQDVTFCDGFVKLHPRWAKNLQKSDQDHIVYLPRMEDSYVCPYVTLSHLFALQHYCAQDPVIKFHKLHVIESQLRRRWSLALKLLNMPVQALTYHSLRRSGASLAFNNNVSFESIKQQGAWQSDAIWQYLFTNSHKAKEIANMFRRLQ